MNFSSIKDFRNNATEEDMKALETFIKSQAKKSKAFPNETYNFSYSSAATELRKHGYLGGFKESKSTEEAEEFIIRAGEKTKFTSRSFSISTDILTRIDKLSDDNWQYSKKAIVNKLLDDALKRYGY